MKTLDAGTGVRYYIRNGYTLEPLTPAVFHILLALYGGERHGYAIMQEAGETFPMGPGTLYGSIKRMLAAGLIEEAGERPDPEMNDERQSSMKRRMIRIAIAPPKTIAISTSCAFSRMNVL